MHLRSFLQQFNNLQTRLEGELELAYDSRLAPSIGVFHVQLIWRNWFLLQLDVEERHHLPVPDVCSGLNVIQAQNNLSWLPTVMNVPTLLALRSTPSDVITQVGSSAAVSVGGSGTPAPVRRDPVRQVRNTSRDPRFTGATPLAVNVSSWKVAAAIALAGAPSPGDVELSSKWFGLCVLARDMPVL
jgi:hypothetical protein